MNAAIVVGTDGSEAATYVVAHAADLAFARHATLHIVSSIPMRVVAAGTVCGPLIIDSCAEVESILAKAVAAVERDGLKVCTHAMQVDPAQAIVATAERLGADLVVVGNRGMTGAKRFLRSSVPNSVAHNAPCPVL